MPVLGVPPLPGNMQGAAASGGGGQPSMMQLAGMGGGSQMGMQPGQSAGMSQISESAVRMGSEIDQALKLLAQAIPQLAPWVEKTVFELRFQIGTALQGGGVPTNPTPVDNEAMPDGSGRL